MSHNFTSAPFKSKPYANVSKQDFDILRDYLIGFLKQNTFLLPPHEV